MTRPLRLIITADDFGRDQACTTEIAKSLADGLITATSLMANGRSFDDACQLAHSLRLTDRIGVHLVLDEGPPVSRAMDRYVNRDGHLSVWRRVRPLEPDLSRAIEAELSAQIERVLDRGIRPTHLDSHRHVHTGLTIGRLVVKLAKTYAIPYVRPARNLAHASNVAGTAYKWAFNRYLAWNVVTADYFTDVVDFYRQDTQIPRCGLIECMAHLDDSPRGLDNRRLLCDRSFRQFLRQFELIGHACATN